jgi:alkylated DNA repair protein (DNA oxidative demethylase)
LTGDLFDSVAEAQPSREEIAYGAVLLRGFVTPIES